MVWCPNVEVHPADGVVSESIIRPSGILPIPELIPTDSFLGNDIPLIIFPTPLLSIIHPIVIRTKRRLFFRRFGTYRERPPDP